MILRQQIYDTSRRQLRSPRQIIKRDTIAIHSHLQFNPSLPCKRIGSIYSHSQSSNIDLIHFHMNVPIHIRNVSLSSIKNIQEKITSRWLSSTSETTNTFDILRKLCHDILIMEENYTTSLPIAMSPNEHLNQWYIQISSLQRKLSDNNIQEMDNEKLFTNQIMKQIRITYEKGVSICIYKKQFHLAKALVHQMQKDFKLVPTEKTFESLLKIAALEYIYERQSMHPDHIKKRIDLITNIIHGDVEVPVSDSVTMTSGHVNFHPLPSHVTKLLHILQAEEKPIYMASVYEREYFQQILIKDVSNILRNFESSYCGEDIIYSSVYTHALKQLALNRVSLKTILKILLQTRWKFVHAQNQEFQLTPEIYMVLVQCARWAEIPAILKQWKKASPSNFIGELNNSDFTTLWCESMKAICNSFTDEFFDQFIPLKANRIRDLQAVYELTDSAFREYYTQPFDNIEDHEKVFELRVKTAALCGFAPIVSKLLNEYVELQPKSSRALSTKVYYNAMDAFSTAFIDVLHFSHRSLMKYAKHSPHIQVAVEEQLREKMMQAAAERASISSEESESDEEEMDHNTNTANNDLDIDFSNKNEDVRRLKVNMVLDEILQERLEIADEIMEMIQRKLFDYVKSVKATENADDKTESDTTMDSVDVLQLRCFRTLMYQYVTILHRLKIRLQRRRYYDFTPQMMGLVKDTLNHAIMLTKDLDLLNKEGVTIENSNELFELNECFRLAFRCANISDSKDLAIEFAELKHQTFGYHTLSVQEYESLIWTSVKNDGVLSGIQWLQESHNHGISPSIKSLHHIVCGILHARENLNKVEAIDSSNDSDPKHPQLDLHDAVTFIQDWYNMCGVKPSGKTAVALLSKVMLEGDEMELKRLIQILESMEGGLTPATQIWLAIRQVETSTKMKDIQAVADQEVLSQLMTR